MSLVDLPGYGFARVKQVRWREVDLRDVCGYPQRTLHTSTQTRLCIDVRVYSGWSVRRSYL